MKEPKIEFKSDVVFSSENFEIFLGFLNEIKGGLDRFTKASSLQFVLSFGWGEKITKKTFISILDFVELTQEDFEKYVIFDKKLHSEELHKTKLNWFYNLK